MPTLQRVSNGRSGEPSALLCACVDSESRESFFPVCKVNLGSMDRKTSNGLLRHTGFQKSDEGNDRYDDFANKWFRGDKDTKAMPKFVSKKSSPHDTNENGWRVAKKDCTLKMSEAADNANEFVHCAHS